MQTVLAFDIETVPDVATGRRLYDLGGLDDADVATAMQHVRRDQSDGRSDMVRQHLQRVVAISAVLRHEERLSIWSLGEADSSEAELLRRFFDGIERYTPTLVSWNGAGFDLPVLHFRALLHGITAPRYWDIGDDDREFRWNNYLGRYHWRHIDLMDVLSGWQPRAAAALHEISVLLGLPGKLGLDGSKVLERWLAGDIAAIRAYCETDVINTWLIFLRFELMRGRLPLAEYDREVERLREYLSAEARPHFREYLAAWPAIA